ncbi:hypothetical protein O1611_g7107 [Lasiodiplodia mahajangana]|uniref:Uncharacterized protein n=1 Tax=Lasiodiplodia mahajangana TaxID=1108764 RepID=A0ACC2JGA7_9PEZI|nr:hypothetical protein O1611_g7107 [Lasiodiplodia mahajangana]
MSEISGLISACVSILGGVAIAIDQAIQAEDRTGRRKKYLESIMIQIEITLRILELIKIRPDLQDSELYSAVALANEKAKELDLTIKSLTKSLRKRSPKLFLRSLFQRNSLQGQFAEIYRNLYQTRTSLILSLIAKKVDTNIFHIDGETVDQIKECFVQYEGMNFEPPILQLSEDKRMLIRNGSSWQIGAEGFEAPRTTARSSNPTISQGLSLNQSHHSHPHRTTHVYDALPDGYIRIMELFPSQFDNDIIIKLHLQPSESDKAPIYEALSYAWGSKFPPSWVRITGVENGELQVTKNLDFALRHLRYIDRSRFLWVDAICIDQLNDFEKGAQVSMMSKIFRSAARVVVWLGPAENHSDRAMALMEYMGSQVAEVGVDGLKPSHKAYDITIAQVYEDLVTHYIVSRPSHLDILAECRLSGTSAAPSWLPEWSWDTSALSDNNILNNTLGFASGHIRAPPTTPTSGELKVWGVVVGRIRRLGERHAEDYTTQDGVIAAIRNAFFFPPSLFLSGYVAGGNLLQACADTLCLGFFRDSYSTAPTDLPESLRTTHLMGKLLDRSHKFEVDEGRELNILLSSAGRSLQARCVYETEEGFIGVAPRKSEIGDQICVLLGCSVPVVLRRMDEGKYVLVGACYTSGVGLGEALLGPLPKQLRFMLVWDSVTKAYYRMFVDKETGDQSPVDPRIKDWPVDYEEYSKSLERDPRCLDISPEVFRARGIYLRSFTLV